MKSSERHKKHLNKRFGRLLVLSRDQRNKHNQLLYTCKCDCGTVCLKTSSALTSGKARSCGCLFLEGITKEPGHTSFQCKYRTYKRGAAGRQITFELSFDDFKKIGIKNCLYCDVKPKPYNIHLTQYGVIKEIRTQRIPSEKIIKRAEILFQGIDRLDNNIGYTKQNSIPCCTFCNFAKRSLSLDEWISYLSRFDENINEKIKYKLNTLREELK